MNLFGEECMGWIQNYKLTEFKVPRNKWCIFDEIESISEGSIMCDRYYIDSDMADEIEKVVHDILKRKLWKNHMTEIIWNQ